MTRRTLFGFTVVAMLVVSLPALAASFDVSFDAARREHHGPVPAVVQVATVQVPDTLVGQACDATFTAVNNTSVHDTDLIVDTNGAVYVVADVESGAATVRDIGPVTVGSVVVVSLRMNEHNARGFAVSSLGGSVTFDCQEPPSSTTTTSTIPPSSTTTTTPVTTTTFISTTSTVASSSTSTSTTTSTSVPGTTVPTTYPDPTDPPPVKETLPETGIESGHLAAVALIALAAGGGLVAITPKEDV